jgi:hypothetical protein
MRHQLTVLPLLLPLAIVALEDLRRHQPRVARVLGTLGVLWIVSTGLLHLLTFKQDPKQEEFEKLRQQIPAYEAVYYMPYNRDLSEPEAPLLTLSGPSVRIVALRPPRACPQNLYRALWALHRYCTRSDARVVRCRHAVEKAGPDWVAQASALAELIGPRMDELMSWNPPRVRDFKLYPVTPGMRDPKRALFVPVWTRTRKFKWYHPEPNYTRDKWSVGFHLLEAILQINTDTTAWRFPEFRFVDAAGLVLRHQGAGISTAAGSLVPVIPRDQEEADELCRQIQLRPDGARFFAMLSNHRTE